MEKVLILHGEETAKEDVRKEVMSELSRRENEKNGQDREENVYRDVAKDDEIGNYLEPNVPCACGVCEGGMGGQVQK